MIVLVDPVEQGIIENFVLVLLHERKLPKEFQ